MNQYPILYANSSKGKVKQWSLTVFPNEDGTATFRTLHGYRGETITESDRIVKTGKNLGKANATTPLEQAHAEALAKYQKKYDEGYVDSLEDLESAAASPLLPMLAHKFIERWKDISYPCYVSAKMDGVRCLATKVSEDEMNYISRKGKSYNATLAHLTPMLLSIMKVGQTLDGEVYVHGPTFQWILRQVKKFREDTTPLLEYWVFDIVDPGTQYRDRHAKLINIFTGLLSPDIKVKYLSPTLIDTKAEVKTMHDLYVQDGFEGIIIRNLHGCYDIKNRSCHLQKYKEFFDDEFKIVGGKEGVGNDAGCVVFEVEVPGCADTCWVRPKGSVAYRQELFKNLPDLIGKDLTVRYQGKFEDGSLQFPVGISCRDYE